MKRSGLYDFQAVVAVPVRMRVSAGGPSPAADYTADGLDHLAAAAHRRRRGVGRWLAHWRQAASYGYQYRARPERRASQRYADTFRRCARAHVQRAARNFLPGAGRSGAATQGDRVVAVFRLNGFDGGRARRIHIDLRRARRREVAWPAFPVWRCPRFCANEQVP